MSRPVTVCVLCYGDYPELAARVLGSLLRFTPPGAFRLRLGLNALSERAWKSIASFLQDQPPELLVRSESNLCKLPMMRRLFYDLPLTTPWTIWFDDDSFVKRCDWLDVLALHSSLQPEVDMWGQPLFVRVDENCLPFIYSSPWFRGRDLEVDDQPGMYRISFIAGGFWAIRTACLHQLAWPDARLLHFGDDYLLGEALRQDGKCLGKATSGIAINRATRRAPRDTPRCQVLH